MPQIRLQSSDSQIFDVDIEVAICSRKIRSVLEDLDIEDDRKKIFRLPYVRAEVLTKILEWATYHKNEPPLPRMMLRDLIPTARFHPISRWDEDFLNIELNILFDIAVAAFHLDIMGLVMVCAKKIVNIMRFKSAKEIRDM